MQIKGSKPGTDFNKWIVVSLNLLFFASITGLFVLSRYFTLAANSFGREVGNIFLQIISVGVVGTILSLLLAKYNQNQQKLLKEQQDEKEAEIHRQKNEREDFFNLQQKIQLESAKELELQRSAQENKNEFLKDILGQLNRIYSNTKSIRRMLRARAFTMPYHKAVTSDEAKIYLENYDNAMEEINTLQLQLEIIVMK